LTPFLVLSDFSAKPIAAASNIDNDTVMQQTVQKRCDYDRVMEEFSPVGKRFVRGDDGDGLLIAIGDESEKQVALLSVYRGVPDLINYNQGRFMVTSAPARAAGIPVFFQLPDKIFHVCKINTHSGLAGLQRKRYCRIKVRSKSDMTFCRFSLG